MTTSRRDLLSGLLGCCVATALARAGAYAAEGPGVRLGEPRPFGPDMVREQARVLATEPFGSLDGAVPEVLAGLSPQQHAAIRFRPEAALWHGLGMDAEVQFFHLGYRFKTPVHVFEVVDGAAREVLYTPSSFDFGDDGLTADFPEDLGFAGLRLLAPVNRPDHLDQLAVFLGASYFRALGRGQRYGQWARGIAVDTGLPKEEEFPSFRAFWLERPAPGAGQVVAHALLDGPSLTGAYTFRIQPGDATIMDVDVTLFPREAIELLGIAPLTSMFAFGPNDRQGVDDFRPQVHDSEGLQIWSGSGEWSWRPLVNPAEKLRLSLFGNTDPKGFGLMQRTREFAAYQDLEARYDLRPSVWIEPLDAWGRGHIRLIEIPSPSEVHDNIVAFWVPKEPVQAGSEWRFRYRLHWCLEAPFRPELAQVVATRVGTGGRPGEQSDGASRKFVIDFEGGQLNDTPADAPVQAVVDVAGGKVTDPIARKNGVTGGWRALFDLHPDGSDPVELRCQLRLADKPLSETWLYQWTL
ncbi:MAG TPA: glucan biosynthesis protein [Geminicoccaceae bacterium]|nr:glucan biosynthesis protein [Geminicoccaceae bacterium]